MSKTDELIARVAELAEAVAAHQTETAKVIADQQAQTASALGELREGLRAFGEVAASIDTLTGALAENQRFVREQQVRIAQRQRKAREEYDLIVNGGGMTPGAPPAGEPGPEG